MELVQGVPITEYCDQCNLTTRERLELFTTVCYAVQHAHQKGIIHRDIKPTNVLVAMQDGRPTPKIIDFGVAKAIDQRLTEKTLATGFAQMIGTPHYMSPEQAELSPLGVDTRSDIYSLGVLLYELLTGTTPFEKDRLHSASYDEMRRIIREEEPPRPSVRLSSLRTTSDSLPLAGMGPNEHGRPNVARAQCGSQSRSEREGVSATETAALATTIATHRRTDPRHLVQTIRGELDWIVMKCLEKDRNRRYETPNSLARDIERYLHDEPVQACPPSAVYRLKKFFRRNKIAAAFVMLLLASVAALTVSNIQARRNERRAVTESTKAQAVSDFLQEMLASSNPDQAKGSKYTMREWLDNVATGLGDQLAGQREVEADIRSVIGKSYWRLGVYGSAEQHLKKALDLRRHLYGPNDERVADSLLDLAWNLGGLDRLGQDRFAMAETHAREALSIYQKRNSDPRAIIRAMWTLQRCLNSQSRFKEAERVANDALALAGDGEDTDYAVLPNILHDLSEAKVEEGKYEEAEELARRSVEMHRRLHGNHHPETAWGLFNLGRALKGQRKFDEAEKALRESLAIFRKYYTRKHFSVQYAIRELAIVFEAQGDREGLEALIEPNEADEAVENTSQINNE
jgi:serine/threonine protein kinase